MINNDRIVPVVKTDLLTLYGTIMKLAGTTVAKASATTPGVFNLTSGSGNIIADEPVKSLDFGASVSAAVIYFVAAHDYEGFSIQGAAVTPESGSAEVEGGSGTLYTATLASSKVTIAKAGF